VSWGLQDVSVSRGRTVALDAVTVSVAPSRVTVVVGGDGAGKSTCLQVLVGLLQPGSGTVRRPAKERIGYVPATAGLYADLTVQENIDFTADAYRLSGSECRLWGGIRQAANAVVGALVTTHNMEEAEQCDRLVVMADAKVVARGTADEITGGRTVAEVRCGDPNRAFTLLDTAGVPVQLHGRTLRVGATAGAVAGLLSGAGIESAVEIVPASLEEAFVEIVATTAAGRAA
jgi:ABC-2 type transport system ATP-binding protein